MAYSSVAMQPDLAPCPYCRNGVGIVETDAGGFTVACGACGMSGPEGISEDEAAKAWSVFTTYSCCCGCRRKLVKRYTARVRELKNEIAALKEASNGKGMA